MRPEVLVEVPKTGVDCSRMPRRSRSRTRRTFRKLSDWLGYQCRVVRRRIISIEGIRIRLGRHISPRVERALTKGAYEREEMRLVEAVLEPDDIVVDIGAGLGLVSAYCAQRIGSERVFALRGRPGSGALYLGHL